MHAFLPVRVLHTDQFELAVAHSKMTDDPDHFSPAQYWKPSLRSSVARLKKSHQTAEAKAARAARAEKRLQQRMLAQRKAYAAALKLEASQRLESREAGKSRAKSRDASSVMADDIFSLGGLASEKMEYR